MRRHELDVTSLVFGLIFAVLAALWPLWWFDIVRPRDLTWVPPVALVVVGVLGIVLSVVRSRKADDPAPVAASVLADAWREPALDVPVAPVATDEPGDSGETDEQERSQ